MFPSPFPSRSPFFPVPFYFSPLLLSSFLLCLSFSLFLLISLSPFLRFLFLSCPSFLSFPLLLLCLFSSLFSLRPLFLLCVYVFLCSPFSPSPFLSFLLSFLSPPLLVSVSVSYIILSSIILSYIMSVCLILCHRSSPCIEKGSAPAPPGHAPQGGRDGDMIAPLPLRREEGRGGAISGTPLCSSLVLDSLLLSYLILSYISLYYILSNDIILTYLI